MSTDFDVLSDETIREVLFLGKHAHYAQYMSENLDILICGTNKAEHMNTHFTVESFAEFVQHYGVVGDYVSEQVKSFYFLPRGKLHVCLIPDTDSWRQHVDAIKAIYDDKTFHKFVQQSCNDPR